MKEKMNNQLSDFISATRMIMILGLVVHHIFTIPGSSLFPRSGMENYGFLIPEMLNSMVHMAFMASVPLLSIISGYLLFINKDITYLETLKKKFFSVALPTWIWSALWLLFALALYWVGHERGWFSWANYNFDQFTALDLFNGVIGGTSFQFAYQFWFVHDLLLCFLLYPFVKWAVVKAGFWFLVFVFVLWFSGLKPPIFFSSNILVFFIVGSYLALSDKVNLGILFNNSKIYLILSLSIFVFLLIMRSWTYLIFDKNFILFDIIRSEAFLSLLRVSGVLAFAQTIYFMQIKKTKVFSLAKKYSAYSFFIFAFHYPTIEVIKVFTGLVPGISSQFGLLIAWLLIPLLTIVASFIAANLLKFLLPKVFSLLNGQRII